MLAPSHLVTAELCCWLFGEPEDRGGLAERFGLEPGVELRTAFGRALADLGAAACDLLCGRFAAVILDRSRDRCLITRDQLGAQPLVYARAADGVLFAEHERDLLDLLPCSPGPDRLALLQWIENGVLPRGRTLYEGMSRLPAGHRLILDAQHVRTERWWDLRYEDSEQASLPAVRERLRAAAFAAVGRAAAGFERPAVELSGGLDSACVAAGLAARGGGAGRALAIAGSFATHPDADESELIEASARHARLPLRIVAFDPQSSMLAPALSHTARWRLPPATPNLFLWQPLAARARELRVDVMLDGEGGDELFGLAPHLIADMLRSARPLAAWSLTGRVPGIGAGARAHRRRLSVLRRYGIAPLLPPAIRRRRQRRALRAARDTALVPSADALALAELRSDDEQDERDGPLWWRHQVRSVVDMSDLLDIAGHFRREVADAGIEARHPFVHDLPLIEAALRLPPAAQFDPVRDRPLLRDALTGAIPEAVRTRHAKSHFSSLVLAGIHAEQAGLIAPLRETGAPVRAYVARAALDSRIETASRSMLGASTLWKVAIANRWLLAEAQTEA